MVHLFCTFVQLYNYESKYFFVSNKSWLFLSSGRYVRTICLVQLSFFIDNSHIWINNKSDVHSLFLHLGLLLTWSLNSWISFSILKCYFSTWKKYSWRNWLMRNNNNHRQRISSWWKHSSLYLTCFMQDQVFYFRGLV